MKRQILVSFVILVIFLCSFENRIKSRKIYDVHIHGSKTRSEQLESLAKAGVYKACISTSWNLQEEYREQKNLDLLFGLMMPCPNGRVPYSLQRCFENGNSFPDVTWVEQQIKAKRIDYLGEILSQYYGISSSDTTLFPYYRLAVKYNIPVGIHTGSAGPNHGSPNFSEEMGNPELLRETLLKFPGLRVWIMHAGAPYVKETLTIMRDFENVYTDVSAINFPPIMPEQQFHSVLKQLIDAGLEDRIMFGSDNNDISVVINSIEKAAFLSEKQKRKIFSANAERFFRLR